MRDKMTAVDYLNEVLNEVIKKCNTEGYYVSVNSLLAMQEICIIEAKKIESELLNEAYNKGLEQGYQEALKEFSKKD